MAKDYNAKIEKQKNASNNHNAQCAHKKYYESDMAIVKQHQSAVLQKTANSLQNKTPQTEKTNKPNQLH